MIKRQRNILETLEQQGDVFVNDLADHFNVSPLTIRRDLDALATEGRLTRTHGGATRNSVGVIRFVHPEKQRTHEAEKAAIARTVASMIKPGSTISLDTGTTTTAVAHEIAAIPDLTVLTSSLAVAAVLYGRENITLYILGGLVGNGSPDLTGDITEDNITRFRVQKAILGADAISGEGIFTNDSAVSRVSRAIMAGGDERIVVADSSKLGQTAFVRIAQLDEIHCIVTDEHAASDARAMLDACSASIHYAAIK